MRNYTKFLYKDSNTGYDVVAFFVAENSFNGRPRGSYNY